ncbi:MAG TPA: ATP-binding protein [bacterium]
MRPSIASRLFLSFLITFLALVVLAGLALYGFAQQRGAMQFVINHHVQEISLFDDIRLQITDAVHQDRDYVLTGDTDFDDAFDADIEEIIRLLVVHAAMHRRDLLTPAEERGTNDLRRAVTEFKTVQDQVGELFAANRQAEARRLSEQRGQLAAAGALEAIQNLVSLERREASEHIAQAAAAAERSYQLMVITGLAAALVIGAVMISVTRSVTSPVQRLVDTMRQVDRGTLRMRTGLDGKDEIGELARHFDHMVARLERTFAEQGRFLADISHELRTPITIIRGHLEILARGTRTPDQVTRALTVSLDELDRMGRLVDDFLLLARATRPDFLAPTQVGLREFLITVFHKATAIAPRDWRLGSLADVTLVADPDRLTEAVLNLLRNAADHTAVNQRVELSSRLEDGMVEIAVADAGEGVSPGDLPHLFERFYRGASPRASGGSGLGLSIVHAVVIAHGGTVGAHSTPGAGSTFSIRLPLTGTAVPPVALERSERP